jgi:N6-adenosine-specific RNA methylase IME4
MTHDSIELELQSHFDKEEPYDQLEQFDFADDLEVSDYERNEDEDEDEDEDEELKIETGTIYLPFHDATSIFPDMTPDEFNELKGDIAANGLRQPILVFRNQVIDGRQRLRACKELALPPLYTTVNVTEKNVTEYIVSMNLKRRHLNESQRAMVATRLATLGKGRKQNAAYAVTQSQASMMLNVSIDSIQRARAVDSKGIPELVHAVQAGTLDVTNASVISSLDSEVQRNFMQLSDKEIVALAKEIRKNAMQERRKKRVESIEAKRANNHPLVAANDGTYNVVYADPPWNFISEMTLGYPTMTLDEIKALPVNEIAAQDAVLFMWCSASIIVDALKVIETWGFNYKTHAIWNKQRIGHGLYFRIEHEILMVATRGAVPEVPYHARHSSVFSDPTGIPSEKPKRIREVIDRMYPELKKIELFCRGEPANGWDGWGNECTSSINKPITQTLLANTITDSENISANDDHCNQFAQLNMEAA